MENIGSHRLTIVGCGPGSPDYLTEAAKRAIESATLLAGSDHLLKIYAGPDQEQLPMGSDINGFLDIIASRRGHNRIAILVSGDPGLFSLAGPVLDRFGRQFCDVIPGISSVQLAFARLGLDWQDSRIISAHKAVPDLTGQDLAWCGKVAILAGHRRSQQWVADLADGLGDGRILIVCEDLSMPGERISSLSTDKFRQAELSNRAIILLLKEDIP